MRLCSGGRASSGSHSWTPWVAQQSTSTRAPGWTPLPELLLAQAPRTRGNARGESEPQAAGLPERGSDLSKMEMVSWSKLVSAASCRGRDERSRCATARGLHGGACPAAPR